MLTSREIDVLNILWGTEEPMTSTDIVNKKGSLTQSTVIAVIRKLLKDKLVKVVGVTHSGKVLSRTFRPTEISKERLIQQFITNYEQFVNIIPTSEMCGVILQLDQEPEQLQKELFRLKGMLEELYK